MLLARWIDSRHTVVVAALVAFLARLPGLGRPARADEAGFLLVARQWDPRPDSLYGDLWVDRPPQLLALVRACDALGGVVALRLVGALACTALVLLAARTAREIASAQAARWTAVAVAAVTSNTLIDAVAVKGEVLALPFLMGSILVALVGVHRAEHRGAARWLLLAGLLGGTALGFKQNLVGGLVFGAILLLGTWVAGRVDLRRFLVLAAALAAGAAVPVAATVAWTLAAGVELRTLTYAVLGFRADASRVIADGAVDAPVLRGWTLMAVALGAGMLLIIGGFVAHVRAEWAEDAPLTAATGALLLTDLAGLVAGGSFWRDYLFPLVPVTALCAAMLARRAGRRGRAMRAVILAATASSAACLVGWLVWNGLGLQEFDEADTGTALRAAADADDTLVVFGGRADLQLASGLPSSYPYLWSLPMRTLDPGYVALRGLVDGPRAPTWLVEWVPFDAWGARGGPQLAEDVERRYTEHGTTCGGHPIWLRDGVERPPVEPDC